MARPMGEPGDIVPVMFHGVDGTSEALYVITDEPTQSGSWWLMDLEQASPWIDIKAV